MLSSLCCPPAVLRSPACLDLPCVAPHTIAEPAQAPSFSSLTTDTLQAISACGHRFKDIALNPNIDHIAKKMHLLDLRLLTHLHSGGKALPHQ